MTKFRQAIRQNILTLFIRINITRGIYICNESSTKTAFIKLNAPPSAVNVDLKMIHSPSGTTCNSTNISAPCPVGIGVSYNVGNASSTYSSNNIASYSQKVEEVDCSNGNILNLLYEDLTPIVPINPSGGLTGLSLNNLNINGSIGYFFINSAAANGKCYKLTFTARNACDEISPYTYFKFNNTYYRPGKTPNSYEAQLTEVKSSGESSNASNLKTYPNPSSGVITFEYDNNKEFSRIEIYNVQG